MNLRTASLGALTLAFCSSFLGASCGQRTLGMMPGVVNDPGNRSLRQSLLAYGMKTFCEDARRRSVPLRASPEDPATGRYYMSQCATRELANGNLLLQFGGSGFLWTNVTGRVGFEAGGAVEYETDFLMDGSTMYVYFRRRSTSATSFNVRSYEFSATATVGGLPFGGGGDSVAHSVGSQVLAQEIGRGFTVMRQANGDIEFGVGLVEVGERPAKLAPKADDGTAVLLADRTELHRGQRDFLGPLEVPKGARLRLQVGVDGAPAADVLLLPRGLAEPWLTAYVGQPTLTAPPGQPLTDDAVVPGRVLRRELIVPPGTYYVVIDNTSTAGRSAPTSYPGDDRAALVIYSLGVTD